MRWAVQPSHGYWQSKYSNQFTEKQYTFILIIVRLPGGESRKKRVKIVVVLKNNEK